MEMFVLLNQQQFWRFDNEKFLKYYQKIWLKPFGSVYCSKIQYWPRIEWCRSPESWSRSWSNCWRSLGIYHAHLRIVGMVILIRLIRVFKGSLGKPGGVLWKYIKTSGNLFVWNLNLVPFLIAINWQPSLASSAGFVYGREYVRCRWNSYICHGSKTTTNIFIIELA